MAVLKHYTDADKIGRFLNKEIDTGMADDAINMAVSYIEKYTGRVFIADKVESIRKFNGNGKNVLTIDDCVEITELLIGADEWGDTMEEVDAGGSDGYYVLPENCIDNGGTYPIQTILLRSRYFIKGLLNVSVEARWGYSEEVPDDVSFACTVIAGGIYNYNRDGGTGDVSSERIGNYSVSYDMTGTGKGNWGDFQRAKEILDNYRRFNF